MLLLAHEVKLRRCSDGPISPYLDHACCYSSIIHPSIAVNELKTKEKTVTSTSFQLHSSKKGQRSFRESSESNLGRQKSGRYGQGSRWST